MLINHLQLETLYVRSHKNAIGVMLAKNSKDIETIWILKSLNQMSHWVEH